MGYLVAALAVAVAAVLVAVVLRRRRGRATQVHGIVVDPVTGGAPAAGTPSPRSSSPPAPMTGLEAALAQALDLDGRPIRDRLATEAVHVDPLRDPNDAGPLLRRALDSVEHHELPPPTGPATDLPIPGDA